MQRHMSAIILIAVTLGPSLGGHAVLADQSPDQTDGAYRAAMAPKIGGHLGVMAYLMSGTADYLPQLLGYARILAVTNNTIEGSDPENPAPDLVPAAQPEWRPRGNSS